MLARFISLALVFSAPAFAQNYNFMEVINPEAADSDDWTEDSKALISQCDDDQQELNDEQLTPLEPSRDSQVQIEMIQWSGGRLWTCFARNSGGRTFSGQSRNQATARRIALNRCISRSNGCFSRSCR